MLYYILVIYIFAYHRYYELCRDVGVLLRRLHSSAGELLGPGLGLVLEACEEARAMKRPSRKPKLVVGCL